MKERLVEVFWVADFAMGTRKPSARKGLNPTSSVQFAVPPLIWLVFGSAHAIIVTVIKFSFKASEVLRSYPKPLGEDSLS